MQKASKKRKASEKPSTFSFINEVEENPSLTIEQKINLIIKSLYKLKDVKGLSQCPRWIKSEQTKTLLSALDINPTDNFKFFDTEDQNQTEFKKAIYALVESFQEGDLETMSGLIKEKKEIFKIYKFKKTSDILMLVTAILGISDRINTYINNGEIRITGLYNSLFDLIFRMNSCIMKGDIIKQISFGEECPYFNVKCDSYAFNASSNVVFVREDKDSEEYDWEKIQTDGYKTIIVGRALLRENIRSYKMKEAELNRYSNFLGMTTNTQRIQCFLLECKYDQQFNPSYHLSKSEFTPTIMEGDHLDLVSLVEFMCRYARDKIPYKAEKVIGEEYVQVGLTPMKRVCDKIPLISKVLKSTVHESPLIIRGCAIKKQLHDNVWLVQSSSILKKTTKKEDFIYSKLLSGSLHCQHLPSVLRYNTDYVEIERLKEIDYKSDWEESELLALLQDMSCALKYLHTINIMHRDVKPNNILLREGEGDYFCYVLVDFDLSCNFEKRMENGQEYLFDLHQKTKINQDCGTSIFRAPEITLEQNYNEQVDIFSLGMTALYLYDPERMEKEYKEGKDWSNLLETSLIQHDLKSIIRRMIDLDPKQRPTATQLESELDNLVKGVSQILEEPEQESKPSSCMDDEIF